MKPTIRAVRNGCTAPSPAQLALALAIAKSKPANMDIKGEFRNRDEYCFH